MIRASGAARPGCSAKVKAPLGGVRINSRPGVHAAGRGARPRVPGDIVGVAPQPLPHQPGAIDSAEPRVELWIAPIVWPPARRTACHIMLHIGADLFADMAARARRNAASRLDRKSTRLNSSH